MTPTEEAAKAADDFANGPAMLAAEQTAKVFEAAGERIASALETAARSGELSFNSLAESVARDLAKLAISELVISPLQSALGSLSSNLFSGPTATTKPPVTVNMTVSGVTDSASFSRSQNQISSTLARAVSSGQRFI